VGSNPAVPISLKKLHRKGFQPQFNSLAEALFCWFIGQPLGEKGVKTCFICTYPCTYPMYRKVNICLHQDLLRLRWRCPKANRLVVLSVGVADTPQGRAYAQSIAKRIEADLEFDHYHHGNNYDSTRAKYRPKTIGKNKTDITTVELFEKFTKHQQKAKGLATSSIKARYQPIAKALAKHLNMQAAAVGKRQAESFADYCDQTLTPATAKARIWLLKSAWDWAKEDNRYPLGDGPNPWGGMADRWRSNPTKPGPKPFTRDQVLAIIGGFRNSRYYSHYGDYVVFLFGTASRPCEAIALRWKDVASDCEAVWIYSTKTKTYRTVSLPPSTAAMLEERRNCLSPSPEDYVFTAKGGGPIDDRNFRARAWTAVLEDLGIEYRRPYTTRKTAISHSLKNGGHYIDVAKAAGHSAKTMHEFYADAIAEGAVLFDFGE
jgi:integrase